jgi:OFA family oxalate/formate antiporter-like MFS transporter
MYTAKGTASLLVPFTSLIAAKGNWHPVFMMAAAMAIIAGLMAVFVLKPMRSAYASRLGSGTVDATAKLATR